MTSLFLLITFRQRRDPAPREGDQPEEDQPGEKQPGEKRPDQTVKDQPGENQPMETQAGEDQPGQVQPGEEDLTDPSSELSEEEHEEARGVECHGYPEFHTSKQEKNQCNA